MPFIVRRQTMTTKQDCSGYQRILARHRPLSFLEIGKEFLPANQDRLGQLLGPRCKLRRVSASQLARAGRSATGACCNPNSSSASETTLTTRSFCSARSHHFHSAPDEHGLTQIHSAAITGHSLVAAPESGDCRTKRKYWTLPTHN